MRSRGTQSRASLPVARTLGDGFEGKKGIEARENIHTLVEEGIGQLYFFEQLLCRVFIGIDLVA